MKQFFRSIRDMARPGHWLWRVRKIVPYGAITLSGMLIVFFLIDRVNKPMAFMSNEFHKVITFALALLSILMAVRVIALQRSEERKDYRKRLRAYQRKVEDGRSASGKHQRPRQA